MREFHPRIARPEAWSLGFHCSNELRGLGLRNSCRARIGRFMNLRDLSCGFTRRTRGLPGKGFHLAGDHCVAFNRYLVRQFNERLDNSSRWLSTTACWMRRRAWRVTSPGCSIQPSIRICRRIWNSPRRHRSTFERIVAGREQKPQIA